MPSNPLLVFFRAFEKATKLLSILKSQQDSPNKAKLSCVFNPNELLCFANRGLPYPPLDALPTPAHQSHVMLERRQAGSRGVFCGQSQREKQRKMDGYHISVRKRTEFLSLGHSFLKSVLKSAFLKTLTHLVSLATQSCKTSIVSLREQVHKAK